MDENEYRALYQNVNSVKCAFEKSMLSRVHACNLLIKHNIGEREAAGCTNVRACSQCQTLLLLLREKAAFTLRQGQKAATMPHAKEIKVQNGGLIGLNRLLESDPTQDRVENVSVLVQTLIEKYGSLENIPFSSVVPAIAHYEIRRRKI